MDDIAQGDCDEDSAYTLYLKTQTRLAEGGFNARKFTSNRENLRKRICKNEEVLQQSLPSKANQVDKLKGITEEDETYAKSMMRRTRAEEANEKVLGLHWDSNADCFILDVSSFLENSMTQEPTKRRVIQAVSRIYDPLGIITPPVRISRWYLDGMEGEATSVSLRGFCHASTEAYAVVVYLRVETTEEVHLSFVTSRTRVAPLVRQTVPRLEVLTALILARLITRVRSVLTNLIQVSYTGSGGREATGNSSFRNECLRYGTLHSLRCGAIAVVVKTQRYPFTRNVSYSSVGRNVVQWS